MSTRSTDSSPGFFTVLLASFGVALLGYGALAFTASPLGGAWLALSGLCLLLSGVFRTAWAAARLGLTPQRSKTVSHVFGVAGMLLLTLFVVVNYAAFESGSSTN